jgi:histidinol-phosphate aminotransferase
MNSLWSPTALRLEPYTPGEQCNDPSWIKLNTNETPFGPSAHALAAIQAEATNALRLYPDPEARALREAVARFHHVDPDMVFAGNGSDEVLAHAFAALFRQDAPILLPDISYNFYRSYCGLLDLKRTELPLTANFAIDLTQYDGPNGGIVFPNPNAPTGCLLGLEHIEELLERHRSSVVIVDEAYVDFGGASAAPLVARHPNLLVVQTLSKSRGLAGLRVGFAIGQRSLVVALERVKNSFNSYPLSRLAIAGGAAAMDDTRHLDEIRALTIANRDRLSRGLADLGFEVLPSHANFVFARHAHARGSALQQALRQQRILVRRFAQPRIEDHLRITVGTLQQGDALLAALAGALALEVSQ